MANQQYNPRRQQQPAPKKKKRSGASTAHASKLHVPAWAWLVVGVAVGVFASFLVKLAHTPAPNTAIVATEKTNEKAAKNSLPQPLNNTAKTTDKTPEKSADKTAPDAKPATRFDFYTLLPEREVIVPNEREAIKSGDKQKTVDGKTQPAVEESLFLQVGSFRSAQEADRRRAQIILLGLDAKVESVLANGDTWYRVQAGPFTSRDKLSKARNQLSAEGIESLLLKQKPAG